jgi:hypothetical protein
MVSTLKKNAGYIKWIVIIIFFLLGILFIRFFIGGSEDDWIKDARGVYVKHGMPSETPSYVAEQQQIIIGAKELYAQNKAERMAFSSQCLGSIGDFAVDIVHVPRASEDNLIENQCDDYRAGRVKHFIELDKEGNIVRIV